VYRRFNLRDCGAAEKKRLLFVKKGDSDGVGGGAGRKTRWNYVEFRNQIDTEANDE
jgi:hypothetical protein